MVRLPLTDLHPFPDHPFQVRDDEEMRETIQSVKEYGVIVPAIVRPREEGGYEIVAGHRRKYACEQAGLDTMPVLIRNLDRDAATIIMVDSNLQRENILPSERAKAYKMKLEAIKRQGARNDLTSDQVGQKSNLTIEEAAKYSGIGIIKLREMTEKSDCPFVLWVGRKRLIKRREFDEYIDRTYSI